MQKHTPIVFIHGNGDSALGWTAQMARFKAQGYSDEELFAITMTPPQNESHDHYVQQMIPFVQEVQAKTGSPRVDIVAHSLGATISRYFIKNFGGAAFVDHAILIAGANHGIPAADLALAMAQPDQFKQGPEINTMGAPFLKALNENNPGGNETFGPVRYMTISSSDDEFYIFNEDSPQLDGADNRVINGRGHFGLRDSEESFACMLAFIENRAETLELGKIRGARKALTDLSGRWIAIGGPKKGEEFVFDGQGSYTHRTAEGIAEGRYTLNTGAAPFEIDLEQKSGPGGSGKRPGIFRINANNTFLRIDLAPLNHAERPKVITYAPCFDRHVENSPLPPALFGAWTISQLGFCAAAGWLEASLSLESNGRFTLAGKNVMNPNGEVRIGGTYTVSDQPAPRLPYINFELDTTDGSIPFFVLGEVMPGIYHLADGKLSMQWGSATFAMPRPSCMDAPVVFEKK